MMRTDAHMHSSFSYDADVCPRQMIEAAIQKGLKTIYFTDHYDKDDDQWGVGEQIFDVERYFKTMVKLQETYRDRINIRIGVELGLQPHLAEYYTEFVPKYPFDLVIGSVHSVHGMDPAAEKLFDGRSDAEVYRMTFLESLEDIRHFHDFDVMGHLDYVVRYGKNREKEYSYRMFADEIDALLKELIEHGKGIELNMAGLKYGLPFAHPHQDILKRYRELGGEIITVGADGHKPEHIAWAFDQANEILKSCNFKYYTEFEDRKPIFLTLR